VLGADRSPDGVNMAEDDGFASMQENDALSVVQRRGRKDIEMNVAVAQMAVGEAHRLRLRSFEVALSFFQKPRD
jgi:hypothetical protein